MKRVLFLLVAIFAMFNNGTAQQQVADATLAYTISARDKDGQTIRSFEPATYTVYIRGQQSRTDMRTALGIETTIYDSKTGKAVILKEYSGQKLMIMIDAKQFAERDKFFYDLRFVQGHERKQIAEFNATSSVAKQSDGKSFEIYYLPEFKLLNNTYNNAFRNLEGIPVQYRIESKQRVFVYTLSSVTFESPTSSLFEIPKSGYRVLSNEETKQL